MQTRTKTALAAAMALTGIAAGSLTISQPTHDLKQDALVNASAMAPAERVASTACEDGTAGVFACDGLDLLGFVPDDEMVTYRDPLTGCTLDLVLGEPGATNPDCLLDQTGLSDIWGWTSPTTGDEFVIFGKTNGTAFFNVTDPTNPQYYGEIPTVAGTLLWHDVKVFENHAYIVSESVGYGVTVFDLTQLDDMEAAATPYLPLNPSNRFVPEGTDVADTSVHNAVIDTDNGVLYLVGGNAGLVVDGACTGGLYAMDLTADPLQPPFLGCFEAEGMAPRVESDGEVGDPRDVIYVHDAHCAAYVGPDPDHQGKDICVGSNEETIVWVDVTDPSAMTEISRLSYDGVAYAHQGWMSEDQTTYFHGDELDELYGTEITNTRTIVVDMTDLDDPSLDYIHTHDTVAIDHNMYTNDGLLYQSNYTAGLRVFDVAASEREGELVETAFFDTYPDDDEDPVTAFNGTWSVYPYFESGTIAVSGIGEGLFLLGDLEAASAGSDDDAGDGAADGDDAAAPGGTDRTDADSGADGAAATGADGGELAATGGGAGLVGLLTLGLGGLLVGARRREHG